MLKVITTLIRGAVAEAEEAVFDSNAIRLLEQQLRDAAASLEHSKRELACAMAHQSSEQRAIEALKARIGELETAGAKALAAGREDLAGEAAVVIAANEDEKAERQAALDRFSTDVRRLQKISDDGRRRLTDLRRGLELARAQDALRRAGANGQRALATGSGALREAESTLLKIRELSARDADVSAALDELDQRNTPDELAARLSDAGFGPKFKTKPGDILARMKARAAEAASDASSQVPR